MSIRPDTWIARMARDHGMIEPFTDGQVREGVISYGLSSYGYDLRVSDEFKIFTNVYAAVVDPKAFDPRSFVDVRQDVCIVPPNSFALARSVEYFRIPRNVLTICVGKSTYARCFAGDARVLLADGTTATLEEMADGHARGARYRGFALGPDGRIAVADLEAPRWTGRDPLVEVVLDNGERVRCTPDHGFLLRQGGTRPAGELRPGDSLMPLYRGLAAGAPAVWQPATGRLEPLEGVRRWAPPLPEPALETAPAAVNHKVARVRPVPGEHDVFCLTVPGAGNFALAAGVFVRNCGIIVNVTPFEPEWEGHVTLEISNTTPLPAKIYAGEGLAQVLFFESDEPPAVSYADRGGKYQAQRGVTLPKL